MHCWQSSTASYCIDNVVARLHESGTRVSLYQAATPLHNSKLVARLNSFLWPASLAEILFCVSFRGLRENGLDSSLRGYSRRRLYALRNRALRQGCRRVYAGQGWPPSHSVPPALPRLKAFASFYSWREGASASIDVTLILSVAYALSSASPSWDACWANGGSIQGKWALDGSPVLQEGADDAAGISCVCAQKR